MEKSVHIHTPSTASSTAGDGPADRRMAMYFHVHLVSDSTGETLVHVLKACVAQFERVVPIEHLYALVRSQRQLDRVLRAVEDAPGVVMFTIVNEELRKNLERRCAELGVPCIPLLDSILSTFSRYLGAPLNFKTGAQHHMDADYDRRIEALNFAIAHDDGQNLHNLEDADVVLVGVSRTSKTPTCIYLAHRGVKAANVPIVSTDALPSELDSLNRPLIVGLTASPSRLVEIRRNRLLGLRERRASSYVDEGSIREEVLFAKRAFERKNWPVIDVSRRSVEETAAKIINRLNARNTDP